MAQIAILKLSEVENLRIEAEFTVLSKKYNFIGKYKGIDVISKIQYGTSNELNEENKGFPILRLNEFDGLFIDKPAKYCDLISKKEFEELKLKTGDVLICRTNGNPQLVGKSAIVMEDTEFAYASYLFKVRTKKDILNPHTLMIFLNTPYGRNEINKYSMTSNQTNFSPAKFREINIPFFSEVLQKKVKELVEESFELKCNSIKLYDQAEQYLLNELSLKDYNPIHQISFKSTMNEVLTSNRFDADYYQPKYREIEQKIKKYFLGSKPLIEVIRVKNNNFFPKDDKEYKYIELSNISSNGNITSCTTDLGKNLPSRARRKVIKGDVIISTIEGSLESCALITEEYDDALCSTGFFVINSKIINSESLLVLSKSFVLQNLFKKGCKGTILTAISKDELDKILIPLIKDEVQKEISLKVKESYKLRKESKELLEKAKKMVEKEIEKEAM